MLMIVIITIILSVAAAVIAVLRQPALEVSIHAVASDPFFVKAALWAQMIGFIAGVWLAFAIFERKKGWFMGFRDHRFARHIAEGIAAGALFITLSCAFIWALGGVKLSTVPLHAAIAQEMIWGFLLFIAVAVNEEMFARGYLQGLIRARFGVVAGVTVSTIFFAFLHSFNPGMWTTPLPIMNLLLAGLLFGVSRELSGSLWMPIGMHLSWNFLQGNVYGFDVSGTQVASLLSIEQTGPAILSGGSFGAEGSLATTIVLLLGIGMITMYHKKYPLKERNVLT
ncbi:CPBP family intramembrane glutamic endopeptidase [Paenibacillus aestuarii]|uniref:CPBP family intramembrane metalloprotease n=1 Tax=Paenibacillus aestuarii TaxID=516965 RepID=A0ABW0K4D7_9BACL|nr:CPBP family intramembrane metalloprotease [Paenibacillus aestuarii]